MAPSDWAVPPSTGSGQAGSSHSLARPTWAPRSVSDWIILGLLILIVVFLVDRSREYSQDFEVFYTAGRRLLDGEEIYRLADGQSPFKYWPGFAYLMVLLACLPLGVSRLLWVGLNVAALYASLALVIGRLFPARRYPIALGTLLLGMQPIVEHVMDGQINLVLLAMILGGFALIGRGGRRADVGTAAIVVAAGVKLFPMLFLLLLPLKRAWRQVVVAGASLVLLLVLPILFAGVDGATHGYRLWWTVLADSGHHLDLAQPANQSLLGMYLRLVGDVPAAQTLFRATALVVLVVTVVGVPRSPIRGLTKEFILDFSIVAAAMLLVSPLTWIHYYVFFLPFTAVIVGELAAPTRGRLAWIGLGLILLAALPSQMTLGRALRDAVWNLSNHVIQCLLVLGYCLYRRRVGPEAHSAEAVPTSVPLPAP